ncbi:MAG: O-antigen ligase family protein [Desulfatibacillaceae bacterium]
MQKLWTYFLPLLFLPNLNMARETAFGTLKSSDFFIVPYLALVFLASRGTRRVLADRLAPVLLGFLAWAALSTLTINWRYGYAGDYHLTFSFLKLAKFTLYAVAGYYTIRACAVPGNQRRFLWALVVSGFIVGGSYFFLPAKFTQEMVMESGQALRGYQGSNGISVIIAMLFCLIGGLWINRQGTQKWRAAALVCLVLLFLGAALSHGRGGWVALFCGAGYLAFASGLLKMTVRTAATCLLIAGLAVAAYHAYPEFRSEVDKTLWPDTDRLAHMQRYNSGVAGLDDGGRIAIWINSAGQVINAPFLGTGFFHRGGTSGIYSTGSHNFFLQIFLETGVVGGVLMLLVFWRMWRQTGMVRKGGSGLPVRAALVAAVAGGMGGEYFYGGLGIFSLFLIYVLAGCQPMPARSPRQAFQPARVQRGTVAVRINRGVTVERYTT